MQLRHELSLCRVYVGSGTTRAFDRRPFGIESMEMVNTEANTGASSSRNTLQTHESTSTSNHPCPEISDLEMIDILDNIGHAQQCEWQHFSR